MRYQHLDFGRRVIIQITQICPLKCAHCIVSAGPEVKQQLEPDTALELVNQLGQDDQAHEIVLTGGEPFVELKLMRQMIERASALGMSTDVVTSCTWAHSPDKAAKVLASLPGLEKISLSADRHHAEFLPLSSVRNAAVAALDLGIRPGLFITLDNDQDDYVDTVRDYLGEELFSKLDLMTQVMHYSGRAIQLHGRLERLVDAPRLPDQACQLPAAPVVLADGRVMACCGDTVSRPDEWKNLTYGNLAENSITDLIKKNNNNHVVQLLRLGGPKALITAAQENGYCCESILEKKFDQSNICEVCKAVTEEDELVEAVNGFMSKSENTFALNMRRMTTFGEWVTL